MQQELLVGPLMSLICFQQAGPAANAILAVMSDSKLALNAIDVFLGEHRHLGVDMITCFAGGIEFSNVLPACLGLHQKFHVHPLTLRPNKLEGSHPCSFVTVCPLESDIF